MLDKVRMRAMIWLGKVKSSQVYPDFFFLVGSGRYAQLER